jgi:DNA-binding response OmpR family regulator
MEKKLNILLIEDDTSLGSNNSEYIVARGFNCLWEQNGELGYKSLLKINMIL